MLDFCLICLVLTKKMHTQNRCNEQFGELISFLFLLLKRQHQVYQAYLSLNPEVRIRRNVKDGQDTAYFLTIKSGNGLIRKEVELDISKAHFYALAKMIERPFVSKDFRVYQLPDGLEFLGLFVALLF